MIFGICAATVGTYHVISSAYEFIHIIKEKIIINPADGTPFTTVKVGNAFVVESNFMETWTIQEDAI